MRYPSSRTAMDPGNAAYSAALIQAGRSAGLKYSTTWSVAPQARIQRLRGVPLGTRYCPGRAWPRPGVKSTICLLLVQAEDRMDPAGDQQGQVGEGAEAAIGH